MGPNNSIHPMETGRAEGSRGSVLPTIFRRNSILINACVRYVSIITATITTITVLITAFSRHCNNSFKPHTHTHKYIYTFFPPTPAVQSAFLLQGALGPYSGEWYLEIKIWALSVFMATRMSLFLDLSVGS